MRAITLSISCVIALFMATAGLAQESLNTSSERPAPVRPVRHA